MFTEVNITGNKSKLQLHAKNPEKVFGELGIGRKIYSNRTARREVQDRKWERKECASK